jgi:hypothetical protein
LGLRGAQTALQTVVRRDAREMSRDEHRTPTMHQEGSVAL